jgi:hypothetical protein
MWRNGRRHGLKIEIFAVSLLFVAHQFNRVLWAKNMKSVVTPLVPADSNNIRALGLTFPEKTKICRPAQRYLETGSVNTGVVGRAPLSANANIVLR